MTVNKICSGQGMIWKIMKLKLSNGYYLCSDHLSRLYIMYIGLKIQ